MNVPGRFGAIFRKHFPWHDLSSPYVQLNHVMSNMAACHRNTSGLRAYLQTGHHLSSFNHANFIDRIKDAAAAKAVAVERHKARPGPDDPVLIAKAAVRKSLHEARVARAAEKERARQEHAARSAELQRLRAEEELALALAREAEIEAEEQATLALKRDRAKLALVSLADQKDVRDARYAARKARQKQAKRG